MCMDAQYTYSTKAENLTGSLKLFCLCTCAYMVQFILNVNSLFIKGNPDFSYLPKMWMTIYDGNSFVTSCGLGCYDYTHMYISKLSYPCLYNIQWNLANLGL